MERGNGQNQPVAAPGDGETQSPAAPPNDRSCFPPWQAKRRWRIVAFWATVWFVLRRNGRLWALLEADLDLRRARRFRFWAVACALVVAAAAPCFAVVHLAVHPVFGASHWLWWVWAAVLGVLVITLWAWLRALAGVVAWFFCPREWTRERQDRGIAMACYLTAPMVLMLPGAALGAFCGFVWPGGQAAGWIGGAIATAIGLYWLQLVICGIAQVFGTRAAIGRGILLCVTWAATWLIPLIPVTIIMWWVMGASLQLP